jgi:IclR family acetate operon transcriptional repressor
LWCTEANQFVLAAGSAAIGLQLHLYLPTEVTDQTPQGAAMTVSAVKSVDRALDLLQHIADAGGTVGISQLANEAKLPLPTVHRMMRSLLTGGYVRQEPSRQYTLGLRLVRLGEAASRTLGLWALPQLRSLVATIGETASMAIFDNDRVVYVAQVPSPHSMRAFTEVGRQVWPHSSGVGKALLSRLTDSQVREIVARIGMPVLTDNTIATPDGLIAELERTRMRGYAVDHEEEEAGARCIAVAVPEAPIPLAISVSGPSSRMTVGRVEQLAAILQGTAAELATELSRR